MNKLIAPSILSSDFMNIESEIRMLEKAGADIIHCDVMDGHFVPNLTFGPPIIKQLKAITSLPLDVHLMISNPEETLDQYIDAGADWLSFHYEAAVHPRQSLEYIKSKGVKAGIVIKPETPIVAVRELIPYCDFILLMSVNPGFGGQSYILRTNDKIKELNELKKTFKREDLIIEVDGGINADNISSLSELGVDAFVAGSAIFHTENPVETIKKMKNLIK